jgi:hypothetical protein
MRPVRTSCNRCVTVLVCCVMNRYLASVTILCIALATLRMLASETAAKDLTSPANNRSTDSSHDKFAPYEFLIGDWDVRPSDDAPSAATIRVRWGPNQSYIWYSSSLLFNGHEEPHLEGMLVWNGVRKNLDMLFSMDLKSGRAQEQGTMSIDNNGALVRDISAIYSAGVSPLGGKPAGPDGATGHFRETYTKVTPDKIVTSAMQETDHGWVPTFPGSDHLTMTRRTQSADPVSGSWNVTFEVEGRAVPGKFELKLTGNTVSGTAESAHTGPGRVIDGVLKNDELQFTLKFATHESIVMTGRAKDGKLSGELRTEGRSGTWRAERMPQ